jgi:hypothetical protein
MIKFFRKIRKNMIKENKVSKYLLYAIGEIILVVIGILIALSINNWNENRKDVLREIKMLQDIYNDTNKNIANLDEGLLYTKIGKQSCINILNYIDNQEVYTTKMNKDFASFLSYWDPDFTEASFENLKNEGVNLISNDSLRNQIIEIFEIDMDILDVSDLNSHSNYMSSVVDPIISKYFYYDWKSEELPWNVIPMDYKTMMNDKQFYSICTRLTYSLEVSIIKSESFIIKAKLLNESIKKEIKQLKK